MESKPQPFDKVLALALKLSPIDKVRLLERIASTLEREITQSSSGREEVEDFRAAWNEAMTDQTYPVSTLWDDVDAE